jgi:hypothetical protein
LNDVYAELGNGDHEEVLKAFTCCLPHPVLGGRPRCPEQWSHTVQKHIHQDAIRRSRIAADEPWGHRLLLLWDGDQLVGIGAHERVQPAGPLPMRAIEFLAVRTDMRGKVLSNGTRCADALLDTVISDAQVEDPLMSQMVATIDARNKRSIGFMTRRGATVADAQAYGCRAVLLTL